MLKTRIGVLRGGPSSEHDVSLKTGSAMLNALNGKFVCHDIFIDRKGEWHINGIHKSPQSIAHLVDVVVNGMHGEYGEDGKVQLLLEKLQVPYTGSNSLGSAVAMNKALSKERYTKAGIPTPYHQLLEKSVLQNIQNLFKSVLYPCVIKPIATGSSVGVRIVKTYSHLEEALKDAFLYSDQVLVEEFISGKEATCGVIDNFRNQNMYTLPSIEIVPDSGFFDYNAKYISDGTRLHCPGRFTEVEKQLVEQYAREAHKVLGLRHYSRSDFIIHPKRGVLILETNTLPGLTDHSLFPHSLKAVGSHVTEFLEHIIGLTLQKR